LAQSPHPVYARGGAVEEGGIEEGAGVLEADEVTEVYERAGIFPWGKRGQKGPDEGRAVQDDPRLTPG